MSLLGIIHYLRALSFRQQLEVPQSAGVVRSGGQVYDQPSGPTQGSAAYLMYT